MTICGRRLLIVEDEPILRITIADALRKEGWDVDVAEDGVKAMTLFERHLHDLVLTDLLMPKMDGMEVLRRVKALQSDTTVVLITAHGTVDSAVEAMRQGAADFIAKPFSMVQLLLRLNNVCNFRLLKEQNIRLQEQLEKRFSFGNIVGKSQEDARGVRAHPRGRGLRGQRAGPGRERHRARSSLPRPSTSTRPRKAKAYIRVSCASLPESLIESELFGYEKGAFTGANERHIGRFEAASGGTLFLDEIGELPLSFQVKLLRVLQERQIERLGSHKPINIDVRIVSASLRPLEEDIAAGQFREDLFFRINTVAIHLPTLRERREDIPVLAQVFLDEFAKERAKVIEGFTDSVLECFDAYAWPGNVRELRNVIERAVLFCRGPRITADELPGPVRGAASVPRRDVAPRVVTLQEAVEQAEIEAIRSALSSTEGRRSEAAEKLGVSRKTLWEKIKNYGILSDD